MDVSGAVVVSTAAVIGIPALVLVGYDTVSVIKKATRMPVAVAYAVSAVIAGCALVALTGLVASGKKVSMPLFVAVFPGFLVALVIYGVWPIRIFRTVNAVAAALLYWNIDVTLHKPLIAAVTPLVVHHCIFALFIKERT